MSLQFKPVRGMQVNRSHPLARGLAACWPLNEGTGNKVYDLSGNGNHGTFYNNPQWASGKLGNCLSFDGDGSRIHFGNVGSFSRLTVSFWAYLRPQTSSRRLLWDNYGITVFRTSSNGSMTIYLGNGSSWSAYINTEALSDNTWYHIVVVYDGASIFSYVDGFRQSSEKPYSETVPLNSFSISTSSSTSSFDGLIDHVMIWDRVLSASEIARLYREPFAVFDLPVKAAMFYIANVIRVAGSVSAKSSLVGTAALVETDRLSEGTGRLRDALFAGMTNNGFKLGTVLTLGWFWVRRAGCSALYRGPDMDSIDFANVLTAAEFQAEWVSPPAYAPHNKAVTYYYVLRRFNCCGHQEQSLSAAAKVSIDSNWEPAEPQPNKVFAARAGRIEGNKVELVWFYNPVEQRSGPARFNIYGDEGSGQINYANPIAVINYRRRRFYRCQSGALNPGKHLFAVRAEDAGGQENDSLYDLGVEVAGSTPNEIEILNAESP